MLVLVNDVDRLCCIFVVVGEFLFGLVLICILLFMVVVILVIVFVFEFILFMENGKL